MRKKRFSFKNIHFLGVLRKIVILAGIFFLVAVGLAFSTLPYWGYHWLGSSLSAVNHRPAYLILLGGGGMPSESNLMRSWYTARAAASFGDSKVIIAMPGDTADQNSTPCQMRDELILRGISGERILFEPTGTNTRSQTLACLSLTGKEVPVMLVTSPENMMRTILCFRKAGYERVDALPAFENAAEADFTFEDDNLGGNRLGIPDVGNNFQFRYQVWTHLKYEIMFAREMVAISYYKIRGWI